MSRNEAQLWWDELDKLRAKALEGSQKDIDAWKEHHKNRPFSKPQDAVVPSKQSSSSVPAMEDQPTAFAVPSVASLKLRTKLTDAAEPLRSSPSGSTTRSEAIFYPVLNTLTGEVTSSPNRLHKYCDDLEYLPPCRLINKYGQNKTLRLVICRECRFIKDADVFLD